ncbi:MAG: hypothetical protein R3C56_13450 [Pirellulaceae bacterium]
MSTISTADCGSLHRRAWGVATPDGSWSLFEGSDGLPYNDFSCMAAGPKGIWFGTSNGAIRYADGVWEFRQGRRWLLDNQVRDIVVTDDGTAWLATSAGISCIEFRPMTLSDKARFYEAEIEKYHRRTSFGYKSTGRIVSPGTGVQRFRVIPITTVSIRDSISPR